MTVGLDTSVAVRLLVGEPLAQAAAATPVLDRGAPVVTISDLVVGETYFVLRHHYDVPPAEAVSALRTLVSDPRVHPTGVSRQVLERLPERDGGPGLMDRLIHAEYARDGSTLLTFDRAAARLPGARLVAS